MADKIDLLDGIPLNVQKSILENISKFKDDRDSKVQIEINDRVYIIPQAVHDLIDCLYRDIEVSKNGIQKN